LAIPHTAFAQARGFVAIVNENDGSLRTPAQLAGWPTDMSAETVGRPAIWVANQTAGQQGNIEELDPDLGRVQVINVTFGQPAALTLATTGHPGVCVITQTAAPGTANTTGWLEWINRAGGSLWNTQTAGQPMALAIAQTSPPYIWVANQVAGQNGIIEKFNFEGESEGNGVQTAGQPIDIAIAPSGSPYIWVANQLAGLNGNIQRFNFEGQAEGIGVQTAGQPVDIAIAPSGSPYIWVANQLAGLNGNIQRFNLSGQFEGAPIPTVGQPTALAIAPSGVWVASQGAGWGRIQRFEVDGTPREFIQIPGQPSAVFFINPVYVAYKGEPDTDPQEPEISVSVEPSVIDFDYTVVWQNSEPESIQISNHGSDPVDIALSIDNDAFRVEEPISPLEAGGQTSVDVIFHPLPFTSTTGTVTIIASIGEQSKPYAVDVTGITFFVSIVVVFAIVFIALSAMIWRQLKK